MKYGSCGPHSAFTEKSIHLFPGYYSYKTSSFEEVLIIEADLIGNVHNESFWINGMALFIN